MNEKTLITQEQIEQRLQELAKEIAYDYQGKEFMLVGILKGAFLITADLIRALYKAGCKDVEISFLILKSYFGSTTVSKDIQLVADIDLDPKGKNVLVVDDVLDTGKSFHFIERHLKERGAKSVTGFVLLAKPDRAEVLYRPKYIGFNVADVWVEGYGMDSAEKGRGNPEVISKTNE